MSKEIQTSVNALSDPLSSGSSKGQRARTGLLLCNLGTPDAPTAQKVRPYLREFLMDERVINIPKPVRFALVNGVIAPFRSPKSAHAYSEIWGDDGSPLLKISEKLTEKVKAKLPEVNVKLAMRYGNPSMQSVIDEMYKEGVEKIIVFPLYPQYSSAATGSSVQKALEIVHKRWVTPAICTVPAFYDDEPYLDSVVAAGKETHEAFAPDHVLFSFHGLPKEHMTLGDESASHCQKVENCCEIKTEANRNCYSMQSYSTAHALAKRIGLAREDYTIAFQSRLPGKPWLTPFTDDEVVRLAKEGKKRVAVYCPAFVADCLETLEEIGMRAKEDFLEAGGEDLKLIPCPNHHDDFVDAVIGIAKKNSAWL